MRIALLQPDPTVGDFEANLAAIRFSLSRAREQRAAWFVLPQGALTGAPLEGLLRRQAFPDACRRHARALTTLARENGFVPVPDATPSPDAVAWLFRAETETDAPPSEPVWISSARPFRLDHETTRRAEVADWCVRHRRVWIEANLAGGQDETVFAGGSFVHAGGGACVAQCAEADFLCVDLAETSSASSAPAAVDRPPETWREHPDPDFVRLEELFRALAAAISGYVGKNRIPGVMLGLSGGIDSALAAALAVEALGAGRVRALTLPGPFTSPETLADARALAASLGIVCETVPIEPLRAAAEASLAPVWGDGAADPGDLALQNLQARARGLLLMGQANRIGWMLVNTSNASEGAMGYGTLYGDLTGTFAPLRDLDKTTVWALSRHINARAGRAVIPETTIARVPSAELAPDQEDRHTLPDYPVLDPMLARMRAGDGPDELVRRGFPKNDVDKMFRLHAVAEYKRRQAIPGPRVSASWAVPPPASPGRIWSAGPLPADAPATESRLDAPPDWDAYRLPMTNRFRER